MTICLTMIVKNEGHLIRETLKHLLTYIRFDSWCICDTGSTDNTISEIESFFQEHSIPGKIYNHEWKDFGHNRTLAFEMAYNTSDYAFVWDADDEIVGEFKLPETLTADWYRFTFGARGCTQYRRCQLFNNRKKWKYVGVLHECPACIEECSSPQDIFGNYHFVSGRRGARNKDPKKYEKDALILEKAFNEMYEKKDGLYKRYAFYAAQSYLCAGQKEKALDMYKKLLTFDTWSQEQYVACLEIYDIYENLNRQTEGLFYLVESFRYDANRAECVLRLIKYYLNAGLPQVALMYYKGIQEYYENEYANDSIQEKLFVRRCDPDFYLPYFMIIVAERTRQYEICAKMFTSILKYKYLGITAWWVQNLFHNLQFFIQYIPKTFEYLQSILEYIDLARANGIHLQDGQNKILYSYIQSCNTALTAQRRFVSVAKEKIKVILTMTTCKRFDLFQQTVNSILNTWTDLDTIDLFFCVDDSSSEEDRQTMQRDFPFFEYYLKTPAEKGHRQSMNIIWKKLEALKPDFWIHIEDDWLFFKKDSYVRKSIEFLEKYKERNIHQILFNRNYAETYNDWNINGGIPLEKNFFLHQTMPVTGRNCAYWKHYSFRPSMVRVDSILTLGDYTSANTFFEGDYASKYSNKGYTSAFFDSIVCLHIGKLTGDKNGVNAYTLNNTSQFKEVKPNTYVVNLERRTDRKKNIEELFVSHGIESYSFFKAVDGKTITVTDEIVRLFTGNDFRNRRGVIGCAMSHYTLWKQLQADSDNDYYIIYEDDITLCEGYKEKLNGVISDLNGRDLVLLGFHVRNEHLDIKTDMADGLVQTNIDKYIGGFFGYILTKSGCKKLLSYIEKNGIKHGIDYLIKICPDLEIHNPQPHIVYSEWVQTTESAVDTDIQKDYIGLELVSYNFKDDWIYYDGVDSSDNDICCIKKPLHELFTIASCREGCVAFNTLGFLKSKAILPFVKTPYIYSSGKGLYVKKGYSLTKAWISSQLCGGLGNRLFQIAAVLGFAEKLGRRAVFYDLAVKGFSHGYYKNIYGLFPNIDIITEKQDYYWQPENEGPYKYSDINGNTDTNILITGYRQYIKYFPSAGISPDFISKCGEQCCSDALSTYGLSTEEDKLRTWFIHVRLGDYTTNDSLNHITADSFYSHAVKYIPKGARVILFSNEPDRADTLICQLGISYLVCNETDECLALYIMKNCWGGAIVPNSTFSWWGAYLAYTSTTSKEYTAYYPQEWFKGDKNSGSFYTPSWGISIS